MRSAAEMSANGGLRNFTMCSDMMVISWCHVEGTIHVYTCVLLKQSEAKSRVSDFLDLWRSFNRLNLPPTCWRQSTCGRRLVDADCIRQLSRGQVRDRVQYLQRRVLRGVQIAVGEHFLIENGDGSGDLAHRRAVARK